MPKEEEKMKKTAIVIAAMLCVTAICITLILTGQPEMAAMVVAAISGFSVIAVFIQKVF